MTDPTSGVVQNLGRRERLVTTLVSKNPETGTKQTLNDSVNSPQSSAKWGRRYIFWCKVLVEEEESGSQTSNIASYVSQTLNTRSLVAVLGDSISNVVDSVIWDLEFVSIGVEEFSKVLNRFFDIIQ